MIRPKVLLLGPDWEADLLAFCTRGLREAGADVVSVPTHHAGWEIRPSVASRLLWKVPALGPAILERMHQTRRRAQADDLRLRVRRAAGSSNHDLVLFTLCWDDPILRCLDVLAEVRAPRVGWFMDDPLAGGLASVVGMLDHAFVVEDSWCASVELLSGRKPEVLYCGADLQAHQPLAQVPDEFHHDISFVGTSYATRDAGLLREVLLGAVSDLGLSIYGDVGWMGVGGGRFARHYRGRKLGTNEVNLLYNGSKIVINVHHPQFRLGTSLRTFAIAASGGFQLVDWRPALDRLFEPGEEIVAYRSPAELREQAQRFLADEPARRRIAQAALKRVRHEHAYKHRMERLLQLVASR